MLQTHSMGSFCSCFTGTQHRLSLQHHSNALNPFTTGIVRIFRHRHRAHLWLCSPAAAPAGSPAAEAAAHLTAAAAAFITPGVDLAHKGKHSSTPLAKPCPISLKNKTAHLWLCSCACCSARYPSSCSGRAPNTLHCCCYNRISKASTVDSTSLHRANITEPLAPRKTLLT
jgi:hypothetical protein